MINGSKIVSSSRDSIKDSGTGITSFQLERIIIYWRSILSALLCRYTMRGTLCFCVFLPDHQIVYNQQVAGWPSGLRRQFKALVFGRGFESHFSHDAFCWRHQRQIPEDGNRSSQHL